MMRILLTGSSGYIGRILAAALSDLGHEVVGLDREAAGNTLSDFIHCDLNEPERYAHRLSGVNTIFHLAAAKGDWGISADEYQRDNLEATERLLEAGRAASVSNWFFYSTVSVLGPSREPLPETADTRPSNPYGETKLACEDLYRDYVAHTPEASVVMIRPSVVFGPENPWNTNIFRLIEAIYRRRFIMIGDGNVIKTTSYIENLLAATLFLFDRQQTQHWTGTRVFHYVDEPAEATGVLVAKICRLLGRREPKLRVPLALASPLARWADIVADVANIDLPITSARIEKFCTSTNFSGQAIRDLGFTQPVAMDDAIMKTVNWYLASRTGKQ